MTGVVRQPQIKPLFLARVVGPLRQSAQALMRRHSHGSPTLPPPSFDTAASALAPAPSVGGVRRIAVSNLVKEYHTPIGRRRILDNISFEVRQGEKIAIVGRNGAGKTTLFKMISGVESPTSGRIDKGLFMSWPLGFAGGLAGEMTGRDNIRFISRLFNRDYEDVIRFVDDFAELGALINIPVRDYSTGMQARLSFGITLAINFECFLIDEILSVGDRRFHRKCHEELFVKREGCAMIIISHDKEIIRKYCSKVLVLKNGRGRVFDDVDFALDIYETL